MTTGQPKRRSPLPPAIRRYLAAARVCRLATASADGDPRLLPLCPVFDGVDTLYVDISPKYRSAHHIAENPRVAVLVDDYAEDWSQLKRVVLQCVVHTAVGAERDAAWRRIRRKFPQYRTIDWQPRLTLALRIEAFRQQGILG